MTNQMTFNECFSLTGHIVQTDRAPLPFTRLNLEQGTPEWLEARRSKVTASKIPAILGLPDAYGTPLTTFEEMVNGTVEQISSFKQRLFDKGHQTEAVLREFFDGQQGSKFKPAVILSTEYPDLLASLDGISEDSHEILEAKYVGAKHLDQIVDGTVKNAHWWQMQAQLLISGAFVCHYLAADDSGRAAHSQIYPDPEAFKAILAATDGFMKRVRSGEIPEPGERDWVQVDAEMLAEEYVKLEQMIEKATADQKLIREKILAKCKGITRARAGALTVTVSVRKGNIDYKKVPQLEGLNLDQYRGKDTQVNTIRVTKAK